jgi:hypothetical protein
MTRKDYQAIAGAIAGARAYYVPSEGAERAAVERVTHAIADALGRDNANFDYRRFIIAALMAT